MSVSSLNNNNNCHVYRAPPPPPPPPARVESTSQQQQPAQVQAAQEAARLERQSDKYEQPKNELKFGAAAQPDLTGKPQFQQWTPETQESQDNVPELGGTNSAGTPKQSAKELIDGANGKQTYPQNTPEDKGAGYAQEKKSLFDAAKKAGASDEEAAVMTAQYMLEGGRDSSKDGDAASKNYGPLNLNGDLLKKSGMSQGEMDKMNELGSDGKPTQEAMDLSAKAAHAAMKDMGVNGYLHHVRGGQTGYEKPYQQLNPGTQGLIQDDPDAFARSVAESAKKVLETGFDNNRYAANIPHI